MAAAGLGQTAAHHVADTQQHNVEPCPIGPEVVLMRVGGTDEEGREQHADNRHHISDEFCCLESSFRLAATAGGNTSRLRTLGSVGDRGVRTMGRSGMRSGITGGHVVLLLTRPKCVDRCYA